MISRPLRVIWGIAAFAIATAVQAQAQDYSVKATVVDKATGAPIEGAYVVLIYRIVPATADDAKDRENPLNGACRKVKGGFTGPDGSVVIPGGQAEGLVFRVMLAIKSGYLVRELRAWTAEDRARVGTHGARFELIARRSPGRPTSAEESMAHDYAHSHASMYSLDCWLAARREDALPAVPFLDILLGEFKTYYDPHEYSWYEQDIGRIKYLLRSLPANGGLPK